MHTLDAPHLGEYDAPVPNNEERPRGRSRRRSKDRRYRSLTSNVTTSAVVSVPQSLACNSSVSDGAIRCYLTLACQCDAALTQETIGERIGKSSRQVRRYLDELVTLNEVRVEHHVDSTGQQPNTYVIAGVDTHVQAGVDTGVTDPTPADTHVHPIKEQNSPKGSAMSTTTPPTQTSSSLPPIDGQLFDAPPEPKPTKRRTRLPDDFAPSERMLAWASETCPRVDPGLETDQFRDHHQAKGNTMADWPAAWRQWMRNAQKWQTPTNSPARRGPDGNGGGGGGFRRPNTTEAGLAILRRRGVLK